MMRLGRWILLSVLLLPVAEVALFVVVAAAIGTLWALAGLLAAALAGVLLLRQAGRKQLASLGGALGSGGLTAIAVSGSGALVLIAGILLIIPGFITDILALLLLLPAARVRMAGAARNSLAAAARERRKADGIVELDRGEWRQVPEDRIEQRRDDKPG